MIKIFHVLVFCVLIWAVTLSTDQFHHKIKACRIGDVVQNECNKCLCTSRGIFDCISTPCDEAKDLMWSDEDSHQACSPNQLYVKNWTTCICTNDSKWPHKSCYKTFRLLPPKNVQTRKCEPNTYVQIDCNVCRCGPNGEFIKSKCTKNNCTNDTPRNTRKNSMNSVIKNNSVYSTCKVKTWYSLAPCQFCYCVDENKLVCNTGNNDNDNNLVIDNYDLHTCGKELIREAEQLIPNNHTFLRSVTEPYFSSEEQVTTAKNKLAVGNNVDMIKEESSENNSALKSNIDEYDSDSQENERLISNTTMVGMTYHFSNDSQILTKKHTPMLDKDEDSNSNQDSSEEYSNEIAFDINPLIIPTKINNLVTSHKTSNNDKIEPKIDTSGNYKSAEVQDQQYSGNTLHVNVSSILRKVFEMAARKSMVSLSSSTKCVPGTTTTNDCNVCFCLKNGKLLCTTNKCN